LRTPLFVIIELLQNSVSVGDPKEVAYVLYKEQRFTGFVLNDSDGSELGVVERLG
jgi:hypothetical protein